MVAADARTAITFSLSPGQAHDAPEGRKLLNRLGQQHTRVSLIMDRAYEGNEDPPTGPWSWGMNPWCRRCVRVSTHGSTTGRCTSGATKSNGCFVV